MFPERLGAKHSYASDGLEEIAIDGGARDAVGGADDAGFYAEAFAGADAEAAGAGSRGWHVPKRSSLRARDPSRLARRAVRGGLGMGIGQAHRSPRTSSGGSADIRF